MTDELLYEVRGPAAWLTINRPDRRNALNDHVLIGLRDGLRAAADDESVRAVVLTGAGDRAFSAGADLSEAGRTGGRVEDHSRRGRLAQVLVDVARHPKPVIARVNGLALAGGFGLALGCDMAVAADDVEVGTPEVAVGLWPFMVSAVVARNVPRKIALEMLMTGRRFSAAEAERWGMVNRVVPRAALDAAVQDVVDRLAAAAPVAVRLGKESFLHAEDMGFEESLEYLNAMLTVELQSEDVAEGVSAFVEKRPPRWRGR